MSIHATIDILTVIGLLFCVYWSAKDLTKAKNEIKQLRGQRDKLFDLVEKESKMVEQFHTALRTLEDAVEKEYGVKVRNETTEVKCEFAKIEMVMFLAGIHKLMNESKNVDDIKIYISLIDKINNILPSMKEEIGG